MSAHNTRSVPIKHMQWKVKPDNIEESDDEDSTHSISDDDKSNFKFPQTGNYTFMLEQAMRVDPLPQIMDVGIRIEKAQ